MLAWGQLSPATSNVTIDSVPKCLRVIAEVQRSFVFGHLDNALFVLLLHCSVQESNDDNLEYLMSFLCISCVPSIYLYVGHHISRLSLLSCALQFFLRALPSLRGRMA